MAWIDRLQQATYESPSGVRLTFDYEDVSLNVDKKTEGFEFPDANGTLVQDLGHSGRRFPLRLFFWGANCDLEAEVFLAALLEKGAGRLEHPIYGTRTVVPFGSIRRRDDLKTAANQTVIEAVFWETINVRYPATQVDPTATVLAAIGDYGPSASASFADTIDLSGTIEQSNFVGLYETEVGVVDSQLGGIAETDNAVRVQYEATRDSILSSINILVDDPTTLAAQTVQLIETPGVAEASITTRLDAYNTLLNAVTGRGVLPAENDFYAYDLFASTYVIGATTSAVNNTFLTKPDALSAAEVLLTQLDTVTAWRDNNYGAFNAIDTGEAYQKMQEAVALAAGLLVEVSFTLKQEYRMVLTRNHTIIDLVGELYGEVDAQLDFFINSNNLSGSEILELPAGREIVYYV